MVDKMTFRHQVRAHPIAARSPHSPVDGVPAPALRTQERAQIGQRWLSRRIRPRVYSGIWAVLVWWLSWGRSGLSWLPHGYSARLGQIAR
jgi:hypothetical protein